VSVNLLSDFTKYLLSVSWVHGAFQHNRLLATVCVIYTVPQKLTLILNSSVKNQLILIIFDTNSQGNYLYIFHLTWKVSLHYLVKYKQLSARMARLRLVKVQTDKILPCSQLNFKLIINFLFIYLKLPVCAIRCSPTKTAFLITEQLHAF